MIRVDMEIRPLAAGDRDWLEEFVLARWGAATVVGHGRVYRPAELPGFVALEDDERLGLVTFVLEDDACEIVTIDSVREGIGVGSALVDAVVQKAREADCRRVWLVTTNDNLQMFRFAQKRGFALVAVHPRAVEASRKLKPEIPLLGIDGIPIRDELELELRL
jgi:N-acetylglutamate synthase-like GNAT family acetyltransferase